MLKSAATAGAVVSIGAIILPPSMPPMAPMTMAAILPRPSLMPSHAWLAQPRAAPANTQRHVFMTRASCGLRTPSRRVPAPAHVFRPPVVRRARPGARFGAQRVDILVELFHPRLHRGHV